MRSDKVFENVEHARLINARATVVRVAHLVRRPGPVLAAALIAFTAIHVARMGLILLDGDSDNYLHAAVQYANGNLPRSRYSPGFGFLLAPIAWLTDGRFAPMYLVASLVNLAVSILALVLVHRFLRRHVSEWAAVALTAILALGQSATNALIAVEIEPLALLAVAATLVGLQSDRPWLAAVATGIGMVSRVALAPFFIVLWILRWRHQPRQASAALALIALGVGAHFATQPTFEEGYVGIAADVYGVGEGFAGVLSEAFEIIPNHILRYARLGIPSMVWPVALLDTPLGVAAGLLTVCCAGVGAWRVLRTRVQDGGDGLLVAAVAGTVAYLGSLVLWPANDGALIRLVIPVSAVVLVTVAKGLPAFSLFVPVAWRSPASLGLGAAAMALALLSSIALVITRYQSPAATRAFISATEQARDRLPRGAILSPAAVWTELLTGRTAISYKRSSDLAAVLDGAERSGACTVIIDEVPVEGDSDGALPTGAGRSGGQELASVGRTKVIALDIPGCPLPPSPE